jgi:hypothetical protein
LIQFQTARHHFDLARNRVNALSAEIELLRHYLAALAYRTQKALRDAPESFSEFRACAGARTPRELVRHMTSVLGYAKALYEGGSYTATPLPTLELEVIRFHSMLDDLRRLLDTTPLAAALATPARLLQGPLADAMTHAGQLALLRRIAGSPVPPENFLKADIRAENVSVNQPRPVSPGRRDGTWDPRGVVDEDTD